MPATKKLTIAALLAVTVSVAGCNSKKASSADSATAATTAAAAPAASAASSGAGAPAATASVAPASGAGAAASGGCALTPAQAATVMGDTYGLPQNLNGICYYAGTANSFSVDVENASGTHDFVAALAAAKQNQQTDTSTTVPGLGDKAAIVQFEIVVAAGGKTIDIRGDSSFGNDGSKLTALAKLVVADLH
jgi:hypothetical protein